jgi:hypothetical protein
MKRNETVAEMRVSRNTIELKICSPPVSYLEMWKVTIYAVIIFCLYGCETWFLMLKGDQRLGVFEN